MLPHHFVLGMAMCCWLSKVLGIGDAERFWIDMKFIWPKNSATMVPDNAEIESFIFGCDRYNPASSYNGAKICKIWNEEDEMYDIGLEEWNITIDLNATPADSTTFEIITENMEWAKLAKKVKAG